MNKRKILVFAHVPPPHHGQSVMVQILLEGLRADPRFEVYHVDARVSEDMGDIGSFRPQKFLRLFKCILQAWWIRLRHGRMAFYYVPAPAKRSAIMRDWVVMALCRPLFPELILHWHAYGLGEWAEQGKDWQRKLTRLALGKAGLSIVLNNYNKRDAAVFAPKRIEVVPNGIADLFPDYDERLAPKRNARGARLKELVENDALRGEPYANILKNVRMSGAEGGREGETGRVGRSESGKVARWESEAEGRRQREGLAEGNVGEKPEAAEERYEGVSRAERDRLERSDSRGAGSPAGEINVGELEVVRFLFLGHLIESKGVFVAIEATKTAKEELRRRNAGWGAGLCDRVGLILGKPARLPAWV